MNTRSWDNGPLKLDRGSGSTMSIPRLTEAQFTATLIELARLRGWLVYHQRAAWTNKGWRTAVQGDPKVVYLDL